MTPRAALHAKSRKFLKREASGVDRHAERAMNAKRAERADLVQGGDASGSGQFVGRGGP